MRERAGLESETWDLGLHASGPRRHRTREWGLEEERTLDTAKTVAGAVKASGVLPARLAALAGAPLFFVFEYTKLLINIFDQLQAQERLSFCEGYAIALQRVAYGHDPRRLEWWDIGQGGGPRRYPLEYLKAHATTHPRSLQVVHGLSFYRGRDRAIKDLGGAGEVRVVPRTYAKVVFQQVAKSAGISDNSINLRIPVMLRRSL